MIVLCVVLLIVWLLCVFASCLRVLVCFICCVCFASVCVYCCVLFVCVCVLFVSVVCVCFVVNFPSFCLVLFEPPFRNGLVLIPCC